MYDLQIIFYPALRSGVIIYEIETMSEQTEQKYCYLVEHPQHGTKIFYSGEYYQGEAARNAVDYAENIAIVFKLPLHDSPIEKVQDLSAQFSAITRTTVELPKIPVEALLSDLG